MPRFTIIIQYTMIAYNYYVCRCKKTAKLNSQKNGIYKHTKAAVNIATMTNQI